MIEVRVELETATMAEIRAFVAMTEKCSADHRPFEPDYSIDHPAALSAEIKPEE